MITLFAVLIVISAFSLLWSLSMLGGWFISFRHDGGPLHWSILGGPWFYTYKMDQLYPGWFKR